MQYKLIFQLGNTPELSKREITALMPSLAFSELTPNLIAVENCPHSAELLINTLGGTVKIFEEITHFPLTDDHAETNKKIEKLLFTMLEQQEGKITFGLAEFGRDHLPPLSVRTIKSKLAAERRSVRYVEDTRSGLSAALLIHKRNLVEYAVIQSVDTIYVAKTVGAQNIDEWTKIDRHKPYADRKKGMLPPKVARMMVNIALGEQAAGDVSEDVSIYDPFCGSGTVLLEAILMSVKNVVGSDLDQDSVRGTLDNIAWLLPQYETKPNVHIFHQDVTQPVQLKPHSISHIVTEPFLGKPAPRVTQLENIYRGLERLYLGAFKQWTKILKDGAVVTIVFPRTEAELSKRKRIFSLEGIIDKLEKIGYTTQSEPILYYRPLAIVQREIRTFVFNKR